jgi:hypothetical protein
MDTVTIKDIEKRIAYLNKLTHSPAEYLSHNGEQHVANVGHYMSAQAYRGIKLERVTNTSGGTTDVLRCGYTTKKNFYALLNAYIQGIEESQR